MITIPSPNPILSLACLMCWSEKIRPRIVFIFQEFTIQRIPRSPRGSPGFHRQKIEMGRNHIEHFAFAQPVPNLTFFSGSDIAASLIDKLVNRRDSYQGSGFHQGSQFLQERGLIGNVEERLDTDYHIISRCRKILLEIIPCDEVRSYSPWTRDLGRAWREINGCHWAKFTKSFSQPSSPTPDFKYFWFWACSPQARRFSMIRSPRIRISLEISSKVPLRWSVFQLS